MSTLDDILGDNDVEPRTTVERLCIDGAALERLRSAERRSIEVHRPDARSSGADRKTAVGELKAARAAADAKAVDFTVRALPWEEWRAIQRANPPSRQDRTFSSTSVDFQVAAIKACLVEPTPTDTGIEKLRKLGFGQWNRLYQAVLEVNGEAGDLGESFAASETTESSEQS